MIEQIINRIINVPIPNMLATVFVVVMHMLLLKELIRVYHQYFKQKL